MYKLFVFAFCLATVATVLAVPAPAYTTKYDSVNLDDVLSNDRVFNNYYKCLMDEGNCSPDGSELKKVLPDALTNECAACSEKQKEGSKKILKFLIEKKPDQWAALEKKYDPNGIYRTKYAAALASL